MKAIKKTETPQPLALEWWPLERLSECKYADNTKRHDIPKLCESIIMHGFRDPVSLDSALGNGEYRVVEGNGRVEALVSLRSRGADAPRGIVSSGDDWLVPVLVGNDADTVGQAVAYLFDHNNLTLGPGFLPSDVMRLYDVSVRTQLEAMAESEMPVTINHEIVKAYIQSLAVIERQENPREDVGPQLDKAKELAEKYQTCAGQLWELGAHRLMIGDSTNPDHVARLMDGQKAALCHADPPYGMGKGSDGVANDNLYGPKLDAFQMAWWKVARAHLVDNASAYVWGNAEDLWRLWYVGGLRDSERLTLRNEIVWDKARGQGMLSEDHRMYPTGSERCLFFMLGEQGFNNNADNYWEGFEPIRAYLDGERKKLGWSNKQIAAWFGFHPRMADHWFSQSQWSFLLCEQYERLQKEARGDAFKREFDELKREFDELKREFYSTRAHFDNTHDNMTDVWNYPRVIGDERHDHPTPKPVPMIERIIKSSAPQDAVVYSPFVGSGTDIVAGESTGRTVMAMEIEAAWAAVTLQRWADLTSLTPRLAS